MILSRCFLLTLIAALLASQRPALPADAEGQWSRFRGPNGAGISNATTVPVTWTTPDEVVLLALDHHGDQLWRRNLGPFVGARGSGASPIIFDDLVVLANDQEDPNLLPENAGKPPIPRKGKSLLIAVDRKTGKTRWQTDRRLYCVAKNGEVVVLAAADKFDVLARMPLGESSYAAPAVAGGVMYLRTHRHLFSLGGKRQPTF